MTTTAGFGVFANGCGEKTYSGQAGSNCKVEATPSGGNGMVPLGVTAGTDDVVNRGKQVLWSATTDDTVNFGPK